MNAATFPPPPPDIRGHNSPPKRLTLLIGGPRNGHVTEWTQRELHVAVIAPIPNPPTVINHIYRQERFRCGSDEWAIFIHSSLTTSEAFAILLKSFPVACGFPDFHPLPVRSIPL